MQGHVHDGTDSEQCLWHRLASANVEAEEREVCHQCNPRYLVPVVKVADNS